MRLDRILQALLPHHDHYFNLFEEAAAHIVEAANQLALLPDTPRERWGEVVDRIKHLEHKGDEVTHRIFSELSTTFVTPFDPEDIHILVSALDDILDNIDGSARRLLLYQVSECPPDMIRLIQSLQASVLEVQNGVQHLRTLRHPAELKRIIHRISVLEDEADEIFAQAVARLFDNHTSPVEIIKLKEIYVALETATDVCDDAADVLEAILIKHA